MDLQGLLRIDGDFEGKIRTDGRVLVGKSGRAMCLIEADMIVVGGIVKGNLGAKSKIVLLSTSIVIGNIQSPSIIIEDGVILHGHCTISEDESIIATAKNDDSKLFSIDWEDRITHTSAMS